MHGLHQIFRICLSQEQLELIRFRGGGAGGWVGLGGGISQHLLSWECFLKDWVLNFEGVPQPEVMLKVLLNYLNMFTPSLP